jgi:predicted PurR-regulated permease PerM
MNSENIQGYFLAALLVVAFALSALLFQPFFTPLVLAAAFAAVLHPVYRKILAEMPTLYGTAALCTLLGVLVCIMLPLYFAGTVIAYETARLYASFSDGSASLLMHEMLNKILASLPQNIPGANNISDTITANISQYAQEALKWLSGHIAGAFSGVASIFLSLLVFLIALFYFLRDGEKFKRAIIAYSPLPDADDEAIFNRLGLAVNSVIRGNLFIALLRGIMTAFGFFLFGVPNSILLGMMTAVIGLLPGIGLVIMFTPAIIYTFFVGGPVPAIGLLAWGIIAVGLIDNVLGPKLVGRGMQLHPLLVLLSIFGGIEFFGAVGIFLGPLCVSLLFALLSIYGKDKSTA